MITENLSTLKIHKLTKEQYERESANGNLDTNALYLTPDEEVDLSGYATIDSIPSTTSQLTNDSGFITDPVFKNMGLNTVNIDTEFSYNYIVGLSETGHGTYPIDPWLSVVNFCNDHFVTQMAFTCAMSNDASRNARMWVRERYLGADYGWSNWKEKGVTYSLSKSGSTIMLNGSDGSVSSVEDNADSGSTTSSGIKREFNTGAIDVTAYRTDNNVSKIYIVSTTPTNANTRLTYVFDYMACVAAGNIYEVTQNYNGSQLPITMSIENGTVLFETIEINHIVHICGYY